MPVRHAEISVRPHAVALPVPDLSVTAIRPLDELSFSDRASIGAKAANLASLRQVGLPADAVPAGFAVPFSFYRRFMSANLLDAAASAVLSHADFPNPAKRQKLLADLRRRIRAAPFPAPAATALGEIQGDFGGHPIRCRSSANAEDLDGFSGAGLYDSFTHRADEGPLAKSIKQVYANVWNYRAVDAREFHGIDHNAAMMGVFLHRNFDDERANGVAVTDDILYGNRGAHYIYARAGENRVTHPADINRGRHAVQEQLLGWQPGTDKLLHQRGDSALQDDHVDTLRIYLGIVHNEFATHYRRDPNDRAFAMEIEFKVTVDNVLVIKQARPWIYPGASEVPAADPAQPLSMPRQDANLAVARALDRDRDGHLSAREIARAGTALGVSTQTAMAPSAHTSWQTRLSPPTKARARVRRSGQQSATCVDNCPAR